MQKKNSSCLYSFLKGCYKFLQAFDRLTSHPLITFFCMKPFIRPLVV